MGFSTLLPWYLPLLKWLCCDMGGKVSQQKVFMFSTPFERTEAFVVPPPHTHTVPPLPHMPRGPHDVIGGGMKRSRGRAHTHTACVGGAHRYQITSLFSKGSEGADNPYCSVMSEISTRMQKSVCVCVCVRVCVNNCVCDMCINKE